MIMMLTFLAGLVLKVLGVIMCPKVLILDLGENLKKAAVIHTTPYCASVEKACLNLKVPILSVTENPVNHGYTLLSVSQGLLEETIFGHEIF